MLAIYPDRLTGTQFRLLELCAGSGNEPIEVRLVRSDLSEFPHFEAISYVWGAQTPHVKISCEGTDLIIGESLYDALLHVRLPKTPRLIWVDAICINQHDVEERSQQVSLMQRIFGQASAVLVWLGQDRGHNIHLALDAIGLIYERCFNYAETNRLDLMKDMSFSHFESIRLSDSALLENAFDERTWSSLSAFYSRAWFGRIWCAQEIILARQGIILVDKYEIPWQHVGIAATVLMAQATSHSNYAARKLFRNQASQCVPAAQLYSHKGKGTLLGNLDLFRERQATDQRDMVYGLLGLQNHQRIGKILQPDYSKSMADVYVDVVMASIDESEGLSILSHVQHEDTFQPESDLPSWAPYWPRQRKVSFLNRGDWAVGGQQAPEVSFPTRREMKVRGFVYEEIVFVSGIHPTFIEEYGSLHPFPELILSLWGESDPLKKPFESSQVDLEGICETLTGGYTGAGDVVDRLDSDQKQEFYSDFLAFIDQLIQSRAEGQGSECLSPRAPHRKPSNGSWERYAQAVRYASCSRRIFRTERGSLGLGPACTKVGDRVCLLRGFKVPCVLRPSQASFHFLGEGYVEGFMQGRLYEKGNINDLMSDMISLI